MRINGVQVKEFVLLSFLLLLEGSTMTDSGLMDGLCSSYPRIIDGLCSFVTRSLTSVSEFSDLVGCL